MKTRIAILLILLPFCFTACISTSALDYSKYNFFALDNISYIQKDPTTGNRFEQIESFYNFNNRNLISEYTVITNFPEYKQTYKDKFNKEGLLYYHEDASKYNERQSVYSYDEKNRIIKIGSKWTYKYIDDTSREIYLNGRLQETETLSFENEKIIVKNLTSTAFVETFFYNNNHLVKYESLRHNIRGEPSKKKYCIELEYDDNNRVVSILTHCGLDDIRFRRKVYYNELNQIAEVKIYKGQNEEFYKRVELLDYDNYGNFRTYKEYNSKNELQTTAHRDIKYR